MFYGQHMTGIYYTGSSTPAFWLVDVSSEAILESQKENQKHFDVTNNNVPPAQPFLESAVIRPPWGHFLNMFNASFVILLQMFENPSHLL